MRRISSESGGRAAPIGGDRYLLLSIAKNAAQEIRGQLVI
jgi:hypothetical protein